MLAPAAYLGGAPLQPFRLPSLHRHAKRPAPARVCHAPRPPGVVGLRRRRAARPRASKGDGGVAAVGSDMNWSHVARDVRQRLAACVGSKESSLDQLQSWLGDTRLSCDLEMGPDHGQAEVVAEQEAVNQGLAGMQVDVRQWLSGQANEETEAKMAGMLTLRLLQAYHDGAGEAFDDESDDSYWRLQGFLPGGLVEALDHGTLRRMIKSYVALPFSGV